MEPLFRHNPEAYLERHLPNWDHSNLSFEEQIPRPNFSAFKGSLCSACWRGYIGEWVIDGGVLQLQNIYDFIELSSLLSLVFPDLTSPIEAFWFSGKLLLMGSCPDTRQLVEQNPQVNSNRLATMRRGVNEAVFSIEIVNGAVETICDPRSSVESRL